MKRMLFSLCLGATLVALPAWSEQVLRLSHNAAPGNPKSEASLRFAELVEEKTDGRIRVEVGGSAQFADDPEALTGMRLGTMAFGASSQGVVAGAVPEFSVLGLPFMIESLPQAWTVLDGPVKDQLAQKAEESGLVLLALWDNGIRHVTNNVRPINTPQDLAGIKIRTPPDPLTVDIFEALGANPTPLPFSELYIALQQGVVDGQENPLMNTYSSKLYEVQKFISLTGHKYESTPFIASKVVFDTLSAEDQHAVRDAAIEAGELNRQLSQQSDLDLRAEMEDAGIQFNEVDKAPFIEATRPVVEGMRAQFPELVELVQQEAAAAAGAQ